MAALLRRGSTVATALSFALYIFLAGAEQILVAELVDDIVSSDIVPGGNCYSGCKREVKAQAHVEGTPETGDCKLQTVTPFNTTIPEPGLLQASIYCEDKTGALIEQGKGPCQFDVCVDFRWTDAEVGAGGHLYYEVVIIRSSKPRASHTVYVELSVAIDPTANGDVDSCLKEGACVTTFCQAPVPYTANIVLTDTEGDGWVGGIPRTYNTWSLKEVGADTDISTGTLADNHDSATTTECLGDGEYIFMTTANRAFADEMGWSICNTAGKAGEGLKFTISDGACDEESATIIERATAEENEDAEFSYCTLPVPESEEDYRTQSCTTLSSGLKIDGVAMYYDDRCTTADYSGCDARSIDGCRLCFVDKELWVENNPGARVPDWEMCPCCVASLLGVDCATASGGGGTDMKIIVGVSVAIAGVMAIACCLSCAFGTTILRFFRRMTNKKHADLEMDLDINGASAFPDSPTAGNGGTLNGNPHGHRGRVVSGHFPIPRFDSIRGRFDSGIFASNPTAAFSAHGNSGSAPAAVLGTDAVDKHHKDSSVATVATAQSSPSATQPKQSPTAPRSTVLDGRLVSKGYTTSDVGRPVSGTGGPVATNAASGWGMAMSGEYPDLEGPDPYAGDNVMTDTRAGVEQRHSSALE